MNSIFYGKRIYTNVYRVDCDDDDDDDGKQQIKTEDKTKMTQRKRKRATNIFIKSG